MSTNSLVSTPEWQVVIRAAQQAVRESIEEAECERKAQELAIEQGKAVHLRRALALFGIDAKPTINQYILDGYRFSLASLSDYDRTDVFRTSDRGTYFKLIVSAIYPEGYENTDNWGVRRYQTYQIIECYYVTDWEDKQAELADALDSTKVEAERLVSEADARRKYLEDHPLEADQEPTAAERLVSLIREIIHEETAVDAY